MREGPRRGENGIGAQSREDVTYQIITFSSSSFLGTYCVLNADLHRQHLVSFSQLLYKVIQVKKWRLRDGESYFQGHRPVRDIARI